MSGWQKETRNDSKLIHTRFYPLIGLANERVGQRDLRMIYRQMDLKESVKNPFKVKNPKNPEKEFPEKKDGSGPDRQGLVLVFAFG